MKSEKANEVYSQYIECERQAAKAVELFYSRVRVLAPLIVEDKDRRDALVSTIDEFYKDARIEVCVINNRGYEIASKIEAQEAEVVKSESA